MFRAPRASSRLPIDLRILGCAVKQGWLCAKRLHTLADMAIFSFTRQFSNVNPDWFYASRYHSLIAWLDRLTGSDLFQRVMQKKVE
ncbi:MAG: hypothetical protein DYH15_10490 [Nitrosomonas sp. PRO4]|nr:hypothetical protein [Nitrosomonas sp. PRO4]